MRAYQGTGLLGLLLLAITSASCLAGSIGSGDYKGYFTKDRWGREVFCNECLVLFVSKDAARKLSPYAGRALLVKVAEMHQPMNPGGAMIRAIGPVSVLPSPVTLGLKPRRAKVTQGQGLTLRLTVRNDEAKPLDLYSGMAKVALMTDSPSTKRPAGFIDPEDRAFWYHQNTYPGMPVEPALQMSYGCRLIPINPTALSKNTHKVPSGSDPTGLADVLTLEPKASCEGDVLIGKELPPGSYSARAWFASRDGFSASLVVDFEVAR